MRAGVSALGCALPQAHDHNAADARDIANQLMPSLGSMLLYWWHWSRNGRRIEVEPDDSIGDHEALDSSLVRTIIPKGMPQNIV